MASSLHAEGSSLGGVHSSEASSSGSILTCKKDVWRSSGRESKQEEEVSRVHAGALVAAPRDSYFAAAVGRAPVPPRAAYTPLTPRRGLIGRQSTTGDPIIDGNNANLQHKARLVDATDLVVSTSNGLLGSILSTRDRLVGHLNKSYDHAVTFGGEYKWVTPKGYGLDAVAKDANLKLTADAIGDRWLRRPRHAPQSVLLPLLERISSSCPTSVDMSSLPPANCSGSANGSAAGKSATQQSGKRMSRLELHDARETLRGVDPHVDTSQPFAPSSSLPQPTLSDVLIGHHDYFHADVQSFAQEELARTAPELERLLRKAALLVEDVEVFASQQNYGEVEERTKELLNVYALYIELAVKRLATLDMDNVEANAFMSERDELIRDTEAILLRFRRDKDKAAADVGHDLRRCAELKQRLDLKITDCEDSYAKNESDINARLKLNQKHHDEIMNEIIERAKILEKLSEDRREMTIMNMQARESTEREVFECNELKERVSEFESLLNQVKAYLGEELTLCDALDAHCAQMARALCSRSFDGDVEDLRFAELSGLHRVYCEFALNSGTLVTKKHHRFEALEREIRLTRLQKDTSKESLDPNVSKYAQSLLYLSELLNDTEKVLSALESQQDAVELIVKDPLDRFEKICSQRGVKFSHPSITSLEKVAAERRTFVDKTQQYVDEEFHAIRRRREGLLQSANLIALEQGGTRLSGGGGRLGLGLLPLSPSDNSEDASATSPPPPLPPTAVGPESALTLTES